VHQHFRVKDYTQRVRHVSFTISHCERFTTMMKILYSIALASLVVGCGSETGNSKIQDINSLPGAATGQGSKKPRLCELFLSMAEAIQKIDPSDLQNRNTKTQNKEPITKEDFIIKFGISPSCSDNGVISKVPGNSPEILFQVNSENKIFAEQTFTRPSGESIVYLWGATFSDGKDGAMESEFEQIPQFDATTTYPSPIPVSGVYDVKHLNCDKTLEDLLASGATLFKSFEFVSAKVSISYLKKENGLYFAKMTSSGATKFKSDNNIDVNCSFKLEVFSNN
jgi:hypothetical protein